jgi:hypothetical protein
MWVGIAALMLTPILMMVLSLVVPYPAIRCVCIVAAPRDEAVEGKWEASPLKRVD